MLERKPVVVTGPDSGTAGGARGQCGLQNLNKAVWFRYWKHLQQESVGDAEDGHISSNAERHCDHNHEGQGRGVAEASQSELNVANRVCQPS
jgi:hypothetical protein